MQNKVKSHKPQEVPEMYKTHKSPPSPEVIYKQYHLLGEGRRPSEELPINGVESSRNGDYW